MEKSVSTFELNRQFFHLFLGLVIVVLLLYGIIDRRAILSIIIVGFILSYLSRIMKLPIIHKLLLKFERKDDLNKFPGKGMIFYFIGCYLALRLFSKDIAMASIMVLALGDSISHIFGIHFGRTRTFLSEKKFLEGTIAGLMAGFIGALVFLPWKEAFFASLAAMIAETIEVKIGAKQVDDNIVVPLVAGAAIWIVRFV